MRLSLRCHPHPVQFRLIIIERVFKVRDVIPKSLLSMSPESFPYEYYDAQRFAIIIEESVVEEETVSEEADMTI